MKNLTIILSAITFVAMVNSNVTAQYIAGDSDVCSDQTLSYLAEEPEGITFRKWLGVNPYLASGSYEWDIEIWIDWDLYSGLSFDLYWTGWSEPGGELEVDITKLVTPSILGGSCTLGSGTATFVSSTHTGATNYRFWIEGFGLGAPLKPESSNGQVTVNLPNTSLPGSVKVKAYYGGGCNKWTVYSTPYPFN